MPDSCNAATIERSLGVPAERAHVFFERIHDDLLKRVHVLEGGTQKQDSEVNSHS